MKGAERGRKALQGTTPAKGDSLGCSQPALPRKPPAAALQPIWRASGKIHTSLNFME